MRDLPSGTVSFLFTDVEGSTRRWEADSPAMSSAIERHFALLDEAIAAHDGVRFKTIGDAIQAAFPTAHQAVLAAIAAQRSLQSEDWGSLGPISVRMALHTGAAAPRDGDYLAPALNRLARLLAAGSGGQILVTEATRNLARDLLPADIQLRDLGQHRLRDLRETERVYQIVAPDLPADFPPLTSLDRPIHNLPVEVTAFIGRETEVVAARDVLAQPDVRLLTLTGPGGTGKTRLALRVARELLGGYPDGVWFVALAPVMNPGIVAATIAETLGLRETPGEPVEQTLRDYLRPRRLLLVLDNFEHVVAAAPLVADLLAHAPSLEVLVTSRAPLRLSGEHELPVPPLALPADDGAIGLDDALASEAVRLFVERARNVRGDFTLGERNASAVAAICRRLDGLPLAIELAAARIRLLSPQAILARLDNRLSLLAGGERDRPERQQTLRAAIAWSHDLLGPEEQTLFRRLGVFAGGCTIDAAEEVTAAGMASLAVLDALMVLVENSLVRQEESTAGGLADPRFSMLQTIQEFAVEQLDANGEAGTIRDAHAAYFARVATAAEPHLTGASAVVWLDRLDADHDNLRAALAWLRERGHTQETVTLAGALWRFWWLRGHVSEGREELERALAATGAVDAIARAAALDAAGVLAETQGDFDRAEALHTEALALSRQAANQTGIARALGNLGVVAADRGDEAQAMTFLEESLALSRALDDAQMVATALNDLGGLAYSRGDLDRAESLLQESLALRRTSGSESEIARSLNNLGAVALHRGDDIQACRLFEESLSLYRAAGDRWGAAGVLNGLALAELRQGDAPAAAALLEESVMLFQELGDTRDAALASLNLADALRDSGELDSAEASYRIALAEFQRRDDRARIIASLAGLGSVMVLREQFEPAARLLGAVKAAAASDDEVSHDADLARLEADTTNVREAMGEDAFRRAWEEGSRLSLQEAIVAAAHGLSSDRTRIAMA